MENISNTFKKLLTSKNFTLALSFIGLYLVSSGVSLVAFSLLSKSATPGIDLGDLEKNRSRINLDLPKTESCPLNGGMFTSIEKDIWESRRPITVVLENHVDSRPPSGLSRADVVYEAVAEGGITRFLAVFYCGVAAEEVKIAPVRSARVYYIDYASEYADRPIFMHVGGANNYSGSGDTAREAQALELLATLGWRKARGNDFDTIYDSGFPVFWRNYERLEHPVATEHTMMASIDATYEEAAKRNLGAKDKEGNSWDEDFVSWKFAEDKSQSASHGNISFKFWDNKPDYDVEWKYDASSNSYLRFNGGKEHTDLEYDNKQLSAKNVVILKARERGPVDRNGHMLYTTVGTGDALVFQNGIVLEGSWEKDSRVARTKFLDNEGREITFVKGVTWVEIVPTGNDVQY